MADDIETAAQLIALAELRDVVIDELAACRNTPPDGEGFAPPGDALSAPGAGNDDAALSFGIRLQDNEIAVRCQVQTGNAYASFQVGGQAVFSLPAPISPSGPEVVQQFTEQVGAPTLFPYLRAAVASLAAQMSIPAVPLPLLQAGDLVLTLDDDQVEADPPPTGPLASGTFTRTNEDGTTEHLGEFFIDAQTGSVVRVGGEGETPDVDEFLNAIAALPPPGEMTAEWMVRTNGQEWARETIEFARSTEGDATADAMLVELEAALVRIAAEDAAAELGQILEGLAKQIATTRHAMDNGADAGDAYAGVQVNRTTRAVDMILHIETGAATFSGVQHELERLGYALREPIGKGYTDSVEVTARLKPST